MNNCCILRATDITLADGVYTITVPDDSFGNLCAFQTIQIGLFTSIPFESECNTVKVTDGTNTLSVSSVTKLPCGGVINDLWQTTLHCRTILVTKYSPVSDTLTLQYVKGRRCNG